MRSKEFVFEIGNQSYSLGSWQRKNPNTDAMVIRLPDDRTMEIFVEHERG